VLTNSISPLLFSLSARRIFSTSKLCLKKSSHGSKIELKILSFYLLSIQQKKGRPLLLLLHAALVTLGGSYSCVAHVMEQQVLHPSVAVLTER